MIRRRAAATGVAPLSQVHLYLVVARQAGPVLTFCEKLEAFCRVPVAVLRRSG